MIRIDFETRSEVNLKRAGPWAYAESPSTEVQCMAYKVNDRTPDLWWPDLERNVEAPSSAKDVFEFLVELGSFFEAHNAEFERAIWEEIMVKRYHWPAIAPNHWRCSAARAAAMALPRALEKVAPALGIAKRKDIEGQRIMKKLMKPRKATKTDDSKWHEASDDMIKLFEYCLGDVEVEYAVSTHPSVYPLSKRELAIWLLDQKINARGVHVDTEAIHACTKLIAEEEKKGNTRLEGITTGDVTKYTQRDRILNYCKEEGIFLENLTQETVDEHIERLERLKIRGGCLEVLKIRRALGRSSVKKLRAMLDRRSNDGRCRSTTMYHGASTGRWTGKGIQVQNFPRGELEKPDEAVDLILAGESVAHLGRPLDVIASCLRGMIKAPEGKILYGADFSAIEARVLNWLAGNWKALKMFSLGEVDPYKQLATRIYGKAIEEITKQEREVGKRAVLGAGYQMGGPRFVSMVKEQTGIVLTEEFGAEVIKIFREEYHVIRNFWYAVEATAIQAVEDKKAYRIGLLVFGVNDRYLHCKLPSGRSLSYYAPKVSTITKWGKLRNELSYKGQDSAYGWRRESTYGGKLVENATQAVARDFLAWAMPRAEAAGYPIIMHVHDELLSETAKDFGSVEEYEGIMAAVPHWGAGCPIKVEGWKGERYRK